MFEQLSEIQRQIAIVKTGKVVVRACPGSGKTYSVAARLAYRTSHWESPNSGIAAISFTNVAWEEIRKKLSEDFELPFFTYPHFLGTIDSFINNYIFLPHGHLIMGCNHRPILVGEPHSTWNVKRYENDYDQYFDIVSYDSDDKLLYPEIQGTFFFPYKQIYLKNGSESQHASNLRKTKTKYWKLGYANQHDANYFALRLLEKYPCIAKALSIRFTELILDEAQDTNSIQMRILEILCAKGVSEIMLVGDPDQAIFEWNNAKPQLFKSKYDEWADNSILLNDNRRSSQSICDCTFHLSTLENKSVSANPEVKNFNQSPLIVVFDPNNLKATIDLFLNKCQELSIEINPENIAILCRSKSFINPLLGNPSITQEKWTQDYSFTYQVLHACFLYNSGLLKQAIKILESVLYKVISKNNLATKKDIDRHMEKTGFLKYRTSVYNFLKYLPPARGNLKDWITLANAKINGANPFSILAEANNLNIESLFTLTETEMPNLNFTVGTVHSVKGETFEAVLQFLKTKGIGKNYTTLINQNVSTSEDEELRIVYVGITRPRRFLMLAVPDDANKMAWENKLGLKNLK